MAQAYPETLPHPLLSRFWLFRLIGHGAACQSMYIRPCKLPGRCLASSQRHLQISHRRRWPWSPSSSAVRTVKVILKVNTLPLFHIFQLIYIPKYLKLVGKEGEISHDRSLAVTISPLTDSVDAINPIHSEADIYTSHQLSYADF